MVLNDLDYRLIAEIQDGLPLTSRPYNEIAAPAATEEDGEGATKKKLEADHPTQRARHGRNDRRICIVKIEPDDHCDQ